MSHSAGIHSRSKREEEKLYRTEVWECANDDCPCWMRKGMSFEEHPTCPMCGSAMVSGERMLPRVDDKPR